MMLPGSDLTLMFLRPGWLWLLLPLLLFAALQRWRAELFGAAGAIGTAGGPAVRPSLLLRHPLAELLAQLGSQAPNSRPTTLLLALAIASLLLSLAEPVLRGERLPDPPQQRDIVFIVDASVAMTLRDYLLNGERVDRMSLLKGVLDSMVQRLDGDRIGIIVFGEHAYTLVPLSRDQALLRGMLRRIEPTIAGRFNALGEAITLAVKQTLVARSGSEERRRLLILLTAAGTPTGSIDAAAATELAAETGLPIYTIAVGAASAAAAEKRDTGLIYRPVDLRRLQHMADTTGALAFRAENSTTLEAVLGDIERRESNPTEQPPRYRNQALYQWPLLIGLLLLTLQHLLPLWRTRRHA